MRDPDCPFQRIAAVARGAAKQLELERALAFAIDAALTSTDPEAHRARIHAAARPLGLRLCADRHRRAMQRETTCTTPRTSSAPNCADV